MNDHDAFLEFIGNLEYLRKHQKLTPDAANNILSGVPLKIYSGPKGSTEHTLEAEASTKASTPEPKACGGAGAPSSVQGSA